MNAYYKWSAVIVLLLAAGCATRTFYEPNAPELSQLEGLELRSAYDAYIIRFPKSERKSMPQIATGARVPGLRFLALPENLDRSLVGRTVNSTVEVLGVVPKGTAFKVVALRREERPVYGISRRFEIEFLGPLSNTWPRVDARWITNPISTNPYIYPEFLQNTKD